MKSLIFDAVFINKELTDDFNNKTSLELIFESAKKNKFDRYILIQNGSIKKITEGIKNIVIKDKTPSSILNAILKESKDSDTVVIFNADSPFYDSSYTESMIERHEKYIADYTYCLGYPDGLTPSILKKEIIKELINLIKDDKNETSDYIFYTISKDINSFDIETFLSDEDLRIYRISLGCKNSGEELITKTLFNEIKNEIKTEKIIEFLKNNLDKLFSVIYLLILELTNYSQIKSIYYPEVKEQKSDIDMETVKKSISFFNKKNNDLHIILGGIGEPLEHPQFIDILSFIMNLNINVIIETAGYLIDADFIKKLKNFNREKITFVIKYDAYNETTYKLIHQGANFTKVKESLNLLKNNGFKAYKEIVRMNENETEIENFIKNKETEDLIIRKYSTFCDLLTDKKVVDLAPLERIPCFHLRREFFIRSDNKVPVCIYSRFKKDLGDLNKDNIESIVNELKNLYIKNAKNDYLDFCVNCNDYYIFNF